MAPAQLSTRSLPRLTLRSMRPTAGHHPNHPRPRPVLRASPMPECPRLIEASILQIALAHRPELPANRWTQQWILRSARPRQAGAQHHGHPPNLLVCHCIRGMTASYRSSLRRHLIASMQIQVLNAPNLWPAVQLSLPGALLLSEQQPQPPSPAAVAPPLRLALLQPALLVPDAPRLLLRVSPPGVELPLPPPLRLLSQPSLSLVGASERPSLAFPPVQPAHCGLAPRYWRPLHESIDLEPQVALVFFCSRRHVLLSAA